jgi:hypothetical protein
MQAWADPGANGVATSGEPAGVPDFIRRFKDRLRPSLVKRLCQAWDRESADTDGREPAQALDRLGRMHQSAARLELGRVHPSWLVRALKDESPAVRRKVAASFPESLRRRVQAELLLDSQDLASERAAVPEVLDWVLGLWTERLIGGEPQRPYDRPVVIAMTRLSPRAGYGLCRLAGLSKLALAGQTPLSDRSRPSQSTRSEWLLGRLADAGSEFQAAVRKDVGAAISSQVPNRHQAARIGLVTFARLLAECEPSRLRWALQHWPYPIAKLTRSLMPPATRQSSFVSDGESLVLKTAWDRFTLEGRVSLSWPGSGGEDKGAI